jgi:hypothetical protein
MTLPPKIKRHAWHFTAIDLSGTVSNGDSSGGAPVLIAACADCGLIRSVVVRVRQDGAIDVSGNCAG